jgi:hypothetical protein
MDAAAYVIQIPSGQDRDRQPRGERSQRLPH